MPDGAEIAACAGSFERGSGQKLLRGLSPDQAKQCSSDECVAGAQCIDHVRLCRRYFVDLARVAQERSPRAPCHQAPLRTFVEDAAQERERMLPRIVASGH